MDLLFWCLADQWDFVICAAIFIEEIAIVENNLFDLSKYLFMVFQVSLGMEKSGEDLEMDFAMDIATVPYRISNRPAPELKFGKILLTFYTART